MTEHMFFKSSTIIGFHEIHPNYQCILEQALSFCCFAEIMKPSAKNSSGSPVSANAMGSVAKALEGSPEQDISATLQNIISGISQNMPLHT